MRRVVRLWVGLMVIAAGAVHVPPAASTQTEEEVEAGLSGAREERSLRTRNSRTFRTPDGALRAVVYPGPIHYRDPSGTWRPIDNSLVASSREPYAWENRANAYRLDLPRDLGEAPVRVEAGGEWVSFALRGAASRGKVTGDTALYPGVLPGVGVRYRATNEAVKEDLILEDPDVGRLSFDLRSSPGLEASLELSGAVALTDPSGTRAFTLAPPYMTDAAGETAAASFELSETPGGHRLEVLPDRAWLRSPERAWPVEVDPTVAPATTPAQDCYLHDGSQATTSFCLADRIRMGHQGGQRRRGLLRFPLPEIPSGSTIEAAEVRLYVEQSAGNGQTIDLHRITRAWTDLATWQSYDGAAAWTTAGGDFSSQVEASLAAGSSTSGWVSLFPTELVAAWWEGTHPNHGLLLKQRTESGNRMLEVASMESADPDRWPRLVVTYTEPPTGPAVTLDSPSPDAGVFHTETVAATVTGFPAARVDFLLDGEVIGSDDAPPYEISWDTTTAEEGTYSLRAKAVDTAQNSLESDPVEVTVINAASSDERVQADYDSARIDVDDYVLMGMHSIFERRLLPERYQSEAWSEDGDAFFDFASVWEEASQAARDEVTQFFTDLDHGYYSTLKPGAEPQEPPPPFECGVFLGWDGILAQNCRYETDKFVISFATEAFHGGIVSVDQVYAIEDSLRAALAKYTNPDVQTHPGITGPLGYEVPDFPIKVRISDVSPVAPFPSWPGADIYLNHHDSGIYVPRHELFHVIQWRYILAAEWLNIGTRFWMEATAVWAGDESEPAGTQEETTLYTRSLPDFLGTPHLHLHNASQRREYGAFILAKYLAQRFGADFIRRSWERMRDGPFITDSVEAIDYLLREEEGFPQGLADTDILPDFWERNYRLEQDSAEGYVDGDLSAWRLRLDDDPRTQGDNTEELGRPARTRLVMIPGEWAETETQVQPGGARYVDLHHWQEDSRPGTVTIEVRNLEAATEFPTSEGVHLRLLSFGTAVEDPVPYVPLCQSPTTLDLTDGVAYGSVDVGAGCRFSTLVITNHQAIGGGSKIQEISAVFVPDPSGPGSPSDVLPQLESTSQASQGTTYGTFNVTVEKPSGTEPGDFLLATLGGSGGGSWYFEQEGWTGVATPTSGGGGTVGGISAGVFYRRAGDSEPDHYSFQYSQLQMDYGRATAVVSRWSGVSSVLPLDAHRQVSMGFGTSSHTFIGPQPVFIGGLRGILAVTAVSADGDQILTPEEMTERFQVGVGDSTTTRMSFTTEPHADSNAIPPDRQFSIVGGNQPVWAGVDLILVGEDRVPDPLVAFATGFEYGNAGMGAWSEHVSYGSPGSRNIHPLGLTSGASVQTGAVRSGGHGARVTAVGSNEGVSFRAWPNPAEWVFFVRLPSLPGADTTLADWNYVGWGIFQHELNRGVFELRYRASDGRLVVRGRDGQVREGPVAEPDRWYRVRAGITYVPGDPLVGVGNFAIDETGLAELTVEAHQSAFTITPQLTFGNRVDPGTYTAHYDDLALLVGQPGFDGDHAIEAVLPSSLDTASINGAYFRSTGGVPTSTDHVLLSDPLDFGTSTFVAQDVEDPDAFIVTDYANPDPPGGKDIHAVTYWVVANGGGSRRVEHVLGDFTTLAQNVKDGETWLPDGSNRRVHANMVHPHAYPWTLAQLGDLRTRWFHSDVLGLSVVRMQQMRLEVMFVDPPGG